MRHKRWPPADTTQDPGREILGGPEVAPPAAEESAEDERAPVQHDREQGPRRHDALANKVVEERLEVERADATPIQPVIRQDVPDQHDMEQDLETDAYPG